jgi:hypothetical protein
VHQLAKLHPYLPTGGRQRAAVSGSAQAWPAPRLAPTPRNIRRWFLIGPDWLGQAWFQAPLRCARVEPLEATETPPWPSVIFGAINMARCEGPTKRTKHIDVQHHYLQEQVASNAFRLQQVSTADQMADFITKPLKHVLFQCAFKLLHLTGRQTRGGVAHMNNNIKFVKPTSRCSAHEHRAHYRRHPPAYRLCLFAAVAR